MSFIFLQYNPLKTLFYFVKYLIFSLFFLPATLLGQGHFELGRVDSDTIPESYRFDENLLREQIYGNLPKGLKEDFKTDRRCLLFAQDASLLASNLLSGGQLYTDWPELESYINKILRRILPDELKGDSGIYVYIARNGECNAFMLPSGHIVVNIGFIAAAPSEAMIAATLLHELAHYYRNHSVHTYLASVKTAYTDRHFFNSKKFLNNSVNMEIEADELSMSWIRKTGYSVNGLKWFFESANLDDENRILRSKTLWKIEEGTISRSV